VEAGKHGSGEAKSIGHRAASREQRAKTWNFGTLELCNLETMEPETHYCRRYTENIIIISDYVLLIDVSLKSKQGHD
jgi:hypothetical protein